MSTLLDIFTAIKTHSKLVNDKIMSPCPSSSELGASTSPTSLELPVNNNSPCITEQHAEKLSIRLILFLESSEGNRSTIFDTAKYSSSNASVNELNRRTSSGKPNLQSTPSIPLNAKKNHKVNHGSNSVKSNNDILNKMVFGSYPMVVSNRNAIKVHSLRYEKFNFLSNTHSKLSLNSIHVKITK